MGTLGVLRLAADKDLLDFKDAVERLRALGFADSHTGASYYFLISFAPSGRGSASDECQEVRIDHVGIRGHHAVWETGVDLERPMFEQLSL